MSLLFLFSCVWFRSNLGYENTDAAGHRIHLSETVRLLNFFGPTLHLELAPENIVPVQQARIGAELSLAPLLMLATDGKLNEESPLEQAFIFSSIGAHLFHYQYNETENLFGVLSPYIQIHSPPLCLGEYETDMTEGLCLTAYGESQYQIFLRHPNALRFHVGLALHYVIGSSN